MKMTLETSQKETKKNKVKFWGFLFHNYNS